MSVRAVGAGVAGGVLAGALVGAAEAVAVWTARPEAAVLPPVGWAAMAYGAAGGLGGAGAGLLAAMAGTGGFGLGLCGVGAALALAVGWIRVLGDAAARGVPPSLVAAALGAAALAGAVVVVAALWRGLRAADAGRRLLTRPIPAAGLVLLLGAGWTLAARARQPEAAPVAGPSARAAAGAPNVVLIVADSLRADHLSCHGSTAVATPHMDALASDGTRYAHAFSPASRTRPAMGSILTGLYPASHGAVRPGARLPERVETVAEALARGGYHTVGFPNDADVAADQGFGQGFAEYRRLEPARLFGADALAGELAIHRALGVARERFLPGGVDVHAHYRPADEVVDQVLARLEAPMGAGGAPWFLFVHFMDPHDPHMARPAAGVGYGRLATPSPSPEIAGAVAKAYAGEVAYLDREIGRLVADLRRRGLYDDALIVLTADHGEELHDHGGWWHGRTLYDEQMAVPLVVKPPRGGARGRVVDELVTTLDVVPTILRAAAIAPGATLPGQALPLDAEPVPGREAVYAEVEVDGRMLRAMRTRAWKLVVAAPERPGGAPTQALYALDRDPGETTDRAAAEPARREELLAALGRATLAAREQAGAVARTEAVDDATEDRLKALGYVE